MSQRVCASGYKAQSPALAWRSLNDRTSLHKALGPPPSDVACFALE
jgi:hypothetical protein